MPVPSITLTAPAKINLSLRLLGKRSDGYHEIETLMAPITLADELELTHAPAAATDTITLTCNDPSLPTGVDNLCIKAAHAFQKASGLQEPITITLLKKIPHGAGLGGGSSNAAAVLRGMNILFNEPLVAEELQELAASLGSDVPFFLQERPSWCRGRGEVLLETPALPKWNLLLIKPPFSVNTTWAYKAWDQKIWNQESPSTIDEITIFNELEAPVFEKHLLLPILKTWLQQQDEVRTAWMSGSGSTMVALLKNELSEAQITEFKTSITTNFGTSFWIKKVMLLA